MISPAYESFVNDICYDMVIENSDANIGSGYDERMALCKNVIHDKRELEKIDKFILKKLVVKYKNPLLIMYANNPPVKFTGKSPKESDFERFNGLEYGSDSHEDNPFITICYKLTDDYLKYLEKWIAENAYKNQDWEPCYLDIHECTWATIDYDPYNKKIVHIYNNL